MTCYKTCIVLLFCLCCKNTYTQNNNLVPNPSFEQFYTCPSDYVGHQRERYVYYWDSPTQGTPDYFNACAHKCGVPVNWVGSANAYNGNAYMGLIGCMEQYDKNQIAYREYIRVKLFDTLTAGQNYYASVHVFLAQTSIAACNGIGLFFSQSDMSGYIKHNFPVKPHVYLLGNPIIDNKNQWQQICGTYTAKGGEQFLIIGNFESDQTMKYKQFDENLMPTINISPMAYYYIDMVEVYAVTNVDSQICDNFKPVEPVIFSGKIITNIPMLLSELYFETDKAVILPQSHYQLDQLAQLLKNKPRYKVIITGHTDNSGTNIYNQTLSEQRAKSVMYYLLSKGVSRFVVETRGYGSSQPVASNNSEAGRQKNRRVIIEIIELE